MVVGLEPVAALFAALVVDLGEDGGVAGLEVGILGGVLGGEVLQADDRPDDQQQAMTPITMILVLFDCSSAVAAHFHRAMGDRRR